jgi:DNA-binding transcriptional regulator GbsR (MarR family)
MLNSVSRNDSIREESQPVTPKRETDRELSDLERESVEYFVSFAQMMGFPKSIGQIYGLLFMSFEPIPVDVVIEKLGISKGSASQGLNLLRDLGAVKVLHRDGDRRGFFQADFDVTRIVRHFLDEKLLPRLTNGEDRLARMQSIAKATGLENPVQEVAEARLQSLQKWQNRGRRLLPLIRKFFRL